MHGTVAAFDEHRGIGELRADDGASYSFHCTAIADGTRTIPVDVAVEFEVMTGPLGGYEAGSVRAR
jgi:cold shock protein